MIEKERTDLWINKRNWQGDFEMGKYYEISSGLELATLEKDTSLLLLYTIMEEMLSCVEQIGDFRKSQFYEPYGI